MSANVEQPVFLRARWVEKWLVLLLLLVIIGLGVSTLVGHNDALITRDRNNQGRAVVCQGQLTDGKPYRDLPLPCKDASVRAYYDIHAKPSAATSEGTKFGVAGVCRLLKRFDPPAPARCGDFTAKAP